MRRRVRSAIILATGALGGCVLLVDTSALTGGAIATFEGGLDADATTATTDGPVDADASPGADGGRRSVLLTGGLDHACAAIEGAVWCWGQNSSGQLGDGTKLVARSPVAVSGLPGPVTAIGAGDYHTCAIVAGDVWCWGAATGGALGTAADVDSVAPAKVTGLPAPALEVRGGEQFTCVLADNHRVYCWGYNGQGRLGDGSPTNHKAASAVVDANGIRSDFAKLSVSNDHACAITTSGDPFCWGHSDNGALGNAAAGGESSRAVPVEGLPGKAQSVTIGGWHACALVDGGAFCWGTGTAGELGNGGTTHSIAPVPVIGHGTGVDLLAAGGGPSDGDTTCASRAGTLSCWGVGKYGRLGDGQTASRATPADVSLPGAVTAIAGGGNHLCAAIATGEVFCWGRGNVGQIGDGAGIDRLVPTRVNLPL